MNFAPKVLNPRDGRFRVDLEARTALEVNGEHVESIRKFLADWKLAAIILGLTNERSPRTSFCRPPYLPFRIFHDYRDEKWTKIRSGLIVNYLFLARTASVHTRTHTRTRVYREFADGQNAGSLAGALESLR